MSDASSVRGAWWVTVVLVILGACGGDGGRAADSAQPASVPGDSSTSAATSPPGGNGARPGRRTILFVGTSLTAGLGLEPERAYPALIQRRLDSLGLNYDVVNAGVSGQTSAGTLRSIDWLMRQPADVVVLETGANDGLRALPVDSMRANIQTILDRVKAAHPDARVYLVAMEAPPNLGPTYAAAFRAVFPELARSNDVTLVPFLLDRVAGVDSLNQSDGIHPNESGAEIVAENVWKVLGPGLAPGTLD